MKKMLTLMIMTLAIVAFGVATAKAAISDTISVTVTITASGLSVIVSPTSWPIAGPTLEGDTPNTTLPGFFTATNDRNDGTAENLRLDAGNSGNWTFANAPGTDQFGMNFTTTGAAPWIEINSSTGGSLATALAAGSSQSFDLQLEVPISTSSGGTLQTIPVTVTAF